MTSLGGGRNVDDQNVDRPKILERQNGLFSWSERRNQNVENVFWVDHYYDITTTTKKDFRRCDFTYGIKKDHNVKNQKYLFKQLPMAY